MNRLLVALLAAFDAALAVAVGLVVALAPLTLLWIFGFGPEAPWSGLWPTAGRLWQLGHLVPLAVTLPQEFTVPAGISEAAASFTVSLAPLALALFTAVFAARSGARAARAGAGFIGMLSGTVVVAAAAAGVAVTTANDIATVELWQAVLFPVLVFAVPALGGVLTVAWRAGDDGVVDGVHTALQRRGGAWVEVPGLIARGATIVVMVLIGAGALLLVLSIVLRGAHVLSLFQAGQVDALGASVITLGQLGYVPTFVVWAVSFLAGPGFAVGADTVVSPVGTSVGVLPSIPVLGALPESSSPWLLLLALVPVAAGCLAGWVARSQLVRGHAADAAEHEPVAPRLVIALGIAVTAACAVAVLAVLASGSFGPGALAVVGPEPGPVALAVGLEAGLGAAILLLSPRNQDDDAAAPPRSPLAPQDEAALPATPDDPAASTDHPAADQVPRTPID
ncbi:cell division protein PerM [Microbacterium wangruii]|uniref:cell division protein PerM n=1 Tax=Microbacterium wangruii TaxID=3049073 RepID=UPI00256F364F|nr:DUF6350 family protein [Microbacterium sp. zg-Y1211]MDL5487799.1 DUF6350 family protein [Microbacterium sp. zg-Y1211]